MKKNFCAQWGADRRLTEQDEGTPSFDWNHGKNGRAKGTKKVRAQNLNYFVFLLFLNFLRVEFFLSWLNAKITTPTNKQKHKISFELNPCSSFCLAFKSKLLFNILQRDVMFSSQNCS